MPPIEHPEVGRRSGLSDASSFMPVAVDSALRKLNDPHAGKRLKETYEYAPKWHLTSAPGFENQHPDFRSMTRKEFTGVRDTDLDHMRRVRDLKTFLRGTTY